MFCQVKVFSKCKDIEKVKNSLFLSDLKPGDNWLNECEASLSPCGSVLAFTRQERLSILCTQWDSSADCTTLVSSWSGSLHSSTTALLALSISSCGQSSQVYADWVCIAVGFQNGEVGFYTEQGKLLLIERFEDSPVLGLKCFTGRYGNETDEVTVVYSKAVCRLAGSNLLQLLSYTRTQLARAEQAGRFRESLEGNSVLTKKLAFHGYELINDACILGLDQTNTFDYFASTSIHEGFYTRSLRSVAPHNTVVVGVGDPYVCFQQALEGGTAQHLLTEVAKAAASKIMSWFGGSASEAGASSALPAAHERLRPVMELRDGRRRGRRAVPSPDRRLLLLQDELGRACLMDARRSVVLRMFKGYRDSQCGFLQVQEKIHKRKGIGRRALFIVLYVGKRGHLEVWPLRGPRIAAFSAALHGKILYTPYASLQQGNHRPRTTNPSLSFIDPDGQIKQLSIPFHFALGNENSDRARDVHLVKRLRLLIKEKECSYEQLKKEVLNTVPELKTSNIKIHCIDMMAASRNVPPGILLIYISCLKAQKVEDEAPVSLDCAKLNILVQNLYALTRLFMYVNKIDIEDIDDQLMKLQSNIESKLVLNSSSETQTDNDSTECPEENPESEEAVQKEPPLITEKELLNFQQLLNLALTAQQKRGFHQKVTFVEDKRSLHSDFFAPFDTLANDGFLKLKDNASQESLYFVALQIFDPCINGDCDWKCLWTECSAWKPFLPADLCKLLFLYWMGKPMDEMDYGRMETFGKILLNICEIEGFERIYVGYNDTSAWWQSIRNLFVNAPCPLRSMVTAQICRAVAQKIERDVENNLNTLEDNAWVSLSRDNAQWGLLIGKLDDISLLSIILSQNLEPINRIPKLHIELPEINLKYIYSSGKGSISELTAKWLCSAGVDPQDIIQDESNREPDSESEFKPTGLLSVCTDTKSSENQLQDETMSFGDKLQLLKKQFPFSLNSDSLIINMCWEYSKYWVKHIEELKYLTTMVHCLKSIQQIPMRCGIASLIWSTHLIHSFEAIYKRINSLEEVPMKGLIWIQNSYILKSQLLAYLEVIYSFFDDFLNSVLSSGESGESGEVSLKFEPIWEESSLALTEAALASSKVNINVLQVHYQLCAAMYYQCYLGTSSWGVVNELFDKETRQCIFGSFKADANILVQRHFGNGHVTVLRREFLGRLVNKCTKLDSSSQQIWIERILELARMWRVDIDHIKRIYVARLYGRGADGMAEDALASVTDAKPLLEALVPLAGRRLKYFLRNADYKHDILSILSTAITTYIESLDEVKDELTVITSLNSTCSLLETIITRGGYDTDSPLLQTAKMLLDSCRNVPDNLATTN